MHTTAHRRTRGTHRIRPSAGARDLHRAVERPVLALRDVALRVGAVRVVVGATLELRAGEVALVLARDRRAARALLACAAGRRPPDAGTVERGGGLALADLGPGDPSALARHLAAWCVGVRAGATSRALLAVAAVADPACTLAAVVVALADGRMRAGDAAPRAPARVAEGGSAATPARPPGPGPVACYSLDGGRLRALLVVAPASVDPLPGHS